MYVKKAAERAFVRIFARLTLMKLTPGHVQVERVPERKSPKLKKENEEAGKIGKF
jgi:hypothetical protein